MNEETELYAREGIRKGLVIAAIGLAVLAAFAVWKLMPRGVGLPEEAHRVLVVDDTTPGLAAYAGGLGFDVVSGPPSAWRKKIADEGIGSSDAGLDEILVFADRYGFGFVAVENPQRFDFSKLGAESVPAFDSHVRFAAVSVGDFAHPTVVTVNPVPSPVRSDIGIDLLAALFAQPRLAATMNEAEATLEALGTRSKISQAISELEQIKVIEGKAAAVQLEMRSALERRAEGIELVDEPMEGSWVIPLADGRVVVAGRHGDLVSQNGMQLDMRVDKNWRFRAISAGKQPKAEDRVDCPELLGGSIPNTERFKIEPSLDGQAVVIRTVSTGSHLWHFAPDAGPCGLVDAGTVEVPEKPIGFLAVRRDAVAAKILVDDLLTVQVTTLDGQRTLLGRVPGGGAHSLVWIDERRLAFLLNPVDEAPSIVFVDLDHPDLVLNYPLHGLDDSDELLPLPGSNRTLLVRGRVEREGVLARVDFSRSPTEMFIAPPRSDVPPVKREGLPTILLLTQQAARLTYVVREDASIRGFGVAPDGQSVVYTNAGDVGFDVLMAPIPAPGGAPSLATRVVTDSYENRDAAFTADGRYVLFSTRHVIDKDAGVALSARSVDPSRAP